MSELASSEVTNAASSTAVDPMAHRVSGPTDSSWIAKFFIVFAYVALGTGAVIGASVGLVLLVLLWEAVFPPTKFARTALPASATEVHEYSWSAGFLPDFEYRLRARIREEEFEPYARRLELRSPEKSKEELESPDSWLSWRTPIGGDGSKAEGWWTPTDDLSRTWIYHKGDHWEYAKYENGFVFYRALSH